MASPRRRKSLSIIEQLQSEPYRFTFFQATRLLERAAALCPQGESFASEPVAQQAPPHRELVRFRSRPALTFAAADVNAIDSQRIAQRDQSHTAHLQWQMEVTFMGLTGAQGVMPYHLSELILQELRNKNDSLREFLDVFNHRTLSMFYQAWHKYQLPANYERQHQMRSSAPDLCTEALMALAGIGQPELRYRAATDDESLAGFAGHLSRNICTADSLARMIHQHFQLPVTIEQFQGQWQRLPRDLRCRLPGPGKISGTNHQLGVSAFLGDYCYHAQSKFTVVVTPLDWAQFMALAPGANKLQTLKSFIHLCTGVELDFDIRVTLPNEPLPALQLVDTERYRPLLGWNTRLGGAPDPAQCVSITLSQTVQSPDESLPLAS